MFKVLIVDDDSVVRTQIKTLIEWDKYGFDLCGEASNGQNAMAILNSERPDIVITDISMPVVDGIALIEHIYRFFPDVKVIAVSGYDDFDYVRKSMKNGAVDYILKYQLSAELLLSNLEAISLEITKRRVEKSWKTNYNEQLTSNREALQQEFINKLISGGFKSERDLELEMQTAGINLTMRNLTVVIAEIDDFQFVEERFTTEEIKVLIKSFLDISKEILNDWEKAEICHLKRGRFVLVFSAGDIYSQMYSFSQLINIINRTRTSIKKYLNITACFSISSQCPVITDLKKSYAEAENALKNRFYKGKDSVIKGEAVNQQEESYFSLDFKEEKAIIAALKTQNKQDLKQRIEEIFQRIKEKKIGYKSTQMICAELINIINKVAKGSGIDVMKIYSSGDIPYQKMQKYDTLIDIKEWLLESFERLINTLQPFVVRNDYSDLTRKTIEYINRNYKRDISLNEAAENISVSSSYLSRTFKEEVGKGFVEYLNGIRVEAAKALIENQGCCIKKVATEVGFNNYTYFFKVFKDISGMTPQEYEKKNND